MNKLNMKINGVNTRGLDIKIDDKKVNLLKNKFGNKTVIYETENPTVNIKIKKYLEINSKLWLLWQMIFFFLSVFGIFDFKLDKKCVIIDCEFEVKLEEITTLNLSMNYMKSLEKALKVDSNADIKEIKNVAYVDEQAKKRMKVLKITKICTFAALLILAVVLLVVLL